MAYRHVTEDELKRYVSGRLSVAEAEVIKQHLGICGICGLLLRYVEACALRPEAQPAVTPRSAKA